MIANFPSLLHPFFKLVILNLSSLTEYLNIMCNDILNKKEFRDEIKNETHIAWYKNFQSMNGGLKHIAFFIYKQFYFIYHAIYNPV